MLPLQVTSVPPSPLEAVNTLASTYTHKLVDALLVVGPVLFAVLCLFWGMCYVVGKAGFGGSMSNAAGGGSFQAHEDNVARDNAEYVRRMRAEDRFIKRVDDNGWELHFSSSGRMYAVDENGRRRYAPRTKQHPDSDPWD